MSEERNQNLVFRLYLLAAVVALLTVLYCVAPSVGAWIANKVQGM